MLATQTPKFVWYLMRGSGLVALVLFTLTVVLGVVGVTRLRSRRWPAIVTNGLHKNLALLSCTFLSVHIVTALIDSWVGLRWFSVVVPFTSGYRPVWVGLGALAVDLLVAVMATSLLRRHLTHRTWRLVHWCTWALWPTAVLHALGAGTDTGAGLGLAVTVSCIGAVTAAAAWRLAFGRRAASARPGRPTPVTGRIGATVPGVSSIGRAESAAVRPSA